MSNGLEALLLRVHTTLDQFLLRVSFDVVVYSRLVTHLPAEQLIHGHIEMLARNVPESNVDGTDRTHDRRAPEVRTSIQILPMVFDQKRILTDEIITVALHHGSRSLQVAPRAGFPETRDSGIRVDLQEQVSVDWQDFQICSVFEPCVWSFAL